PPFLLRLHARFLDDGHPLVDFGPEVGAQHLRPRTRRIDRLGRPSVPAGLSPRGPAEPFATPSITFPPRVLACPWAHTSRTRQPFESRAIRIPILSADRARP